MYIYLDFYIVYLSSFSFLLKKESSRFLALPITSEARIRPDEGDIRLGGLVGESWSDGLGFIILCFVTGISGASSILYGECLGGGRSMGASRTRYGEGFGGGSMTGLSEGKSLISVGWYITSEGTPDGASTTLYSPTGLLGLSGDKDLGGSGIWWKLLGGFSDEM